MAGGWRPRGALGALLAVSACGFDTSGLGTATGAGVGQGSDPSSSAGEPETSTGGSTGQAEGDATSSSGEGPSDPSSAGAEDDADDTAGDTTGPAIDPCADPLPVTFEIDVTQALLEAPMQLAVSPTEGTYAYSEVADQGRVSFQFSVPCQAEFRAWARVYDPNVLALTDPDAFAVAFDGEANAEWWYGCQTIYSGGIGATWAWVPLTENPLCIAEDFRRTLSPGTHLLHLTNLEAGNHASANVAAVARVVVTSDPAFMP